MSPDYSLTPNQDEGLVRSAVLIAAVGLGLFSLFALVVTELGVLPNGLRNVVFPTATLVLVNLILSVRPLQWCSGPWSAWLYEAFHAIAFTLMLHRLGGIALTLFLPIYGFLVVHTEMLDPAASPFVTASLCAVAYGALAWIEYSGIAPAPIGFVAPVSPAVAWLYVGFAALSLNFLALYAYRHAQHLRSLAGRLESMVDARTRELLRTNQSLAAAADALEHKTAELQSFAYTITHDLKNPINSICLLADMIQSRDGARLSPVSRDDLAEIVKAADGAERMILDLLGMFRVTTATEDPRWIRVEDLVTQAMDTLAPQIAAKKLAVEVGFLPIVWGQAMKLARAIENLLSNAVKFTAGDSGRLRVEGDQDESWARIRVSDNGIGIPQVYHQRIFDLFARVPADEQPMDEPAAPGSGVGLATVKQVVELHGGTVRVRSAPGQGSTFEIDLPMPAADAAARNPAHA